MTVGKMMPLDSATDVLHRFETLPHRIFLDSSVLQTLHDYGAEIYDLEELEDGDRIRDIPEGTKELDALSNIMKLVERAPTFFEMAISAVRQPELSFLL